MILPVLSHPFVRLSPSAPWKWHFQESGWHANTLVGELSDHNDPLYLPHPKTELHKTFFPLAFYMMLNWGSVEPLMCKDSYSDTSIRGFKFHPLTITYRLNWPQLTVKSWLLCLPVLQTPPGARDPAVLYSASHIFRSNKALAIGI